MANQTAETERIRSLYEKDAAKYDRQIQIFERMLFAGGREWVCSQAEGDVLEIAIGTGRNLGLYPDDVSLTGIEFSPAMLEIAIRPLSKNQSASGVPATRSLRCGGGNGSPSSLRRR